jgi:hypothetical protein
MPQGVIDRLELIEIDEDQDATDAMTAGDRQFMGQAFLKPTAVEHAGEGVGGREIFQLGDALVLLLEMRGDFGNQRVRPLGDLQHRTGTVDFLFGTHLFRDANKLGELRHNGSVVLLRLEDALRLRQYRHFE